MVNVPVLAVFPEADPEIIPKKALPTTAALAGPPVARPAIDIAILTNHRPAPE